MNQPNLTCSKYSCTKESDTIALARALSVIASSGCLITLEGDLGAGKSFFARAFIQSYLNNRQLEVPSPTYNLAIEHISPSGKCATHMDLYRLSSPEEVDELGIDDALEQGLVLIEWPDQPGAELPKPFIAVQIEIISQRERKITLIASPAIQKQITRSIEIAKFLRANWDVDPKRTPFPADASSRNYEWIETEQEKRILMDAPKMPDGPIIQNGLPYSQIAHLAEEVRPFVAIANTLCANDFRAPKIFATDFELGLILLEYLGDGAITNAENQPIPSRYHDAGKFLALLHHTKWEKKLPTDDGIDHKLPIYDPTSMLIEAQLLTQWYLQDEQYTNVSDEDVTEYSAIWSHYAQQAQSFRQSIVLRDYHSPNIIWQDAKHLRQRIGVIDFQDALLGPAVYDVVSLAQDARVSVSRKLEVEIIQHYLAKYQANNLEFDVDSFSYEYAMMGALRASKVLGFCVRVDLRDGKPQYRALIPQIRDYLKRNLQHPKLHQYRIWCERVINL